MPKLYRLYEVELISTDNLPYSRSTKIQEIVHTVIQLKKEDINVKIVIFTQCEEMILALSNVLSRNRICVLDGLDLEKFTNHLSDFKVY